jgi:dihydroorotate dehydrogenase (fumarate)
LSNVFIDVIGCGGVKTGRDVFEHILAGASAVQVGTSLYKNGPDHFNTILAELEDIMRKKRYIYLSDFRGKLKTL